MRQIKVQLRQELKWRKKNCEAKRLKTVSAGLLIALAMFSIGQAQGITKSDSLQIIEQLTVYAEQLELDIKMQQIDCAAQAELDSMKIARLQEQYHEMQPSKLERILTDTRLHFALGVWLGISAKKW